MTRANRRVVVLLFAGLALVGPAAGRTLAAEGEAEIEAARQRADKLKEADRYAEAAAIYEALVPEAETVYGKDHPHRREVPEQPGGAVLVHGPTRQSRAALAAEPGDLGIQARQGPSGRGGQHTGI